MERVPYELLGEMTFVDGAMCHRIQRVDLAERYGMTLAMLTFLNVHARCFRCEQSLDGLERHAACFPRRHRLFFSNEPSHFEVLVPEVLQGEFSAIKFKDSQRRQSFLRSLRVKEASGQHTCEQILDLLHRQEQRCYYCFVTLVGPNGLVNDLDEPITCHVDHYEALIYGGSKNITNLVLACPSCNTRKRDMHGDDFAIEALERASKADRKGLDRIHKIRAQFIQAALERRPGE